MDEDYTSIMAGLCCGVPSVQEDNLLPIINDDHYIIMMIGGTFHLRCGKKRVCVCIYIYDDHHV